MTLFEAQQKFPPIWIIYRTPHNFPRHWVVRIWYGETPSPIACLCVSPGEAREQIPPGSIKLKVFPSDNITIFEAWI